MKTPRRNISPAVSRRKKDRIVFVHAPKMDSYTIQIDGVKVEVYSTRKKPISFTEFVATAVRETPVVNFVAGKWAKRVLDVATAERGCTMRKCSSKEIK